MPFNLLDHADLWFDGANVAIPLPNHTVHLWGGYD